MRPLVLAALLALSSPASAAPSFDGTWWGTLDAGVIKLRVVFNLRHDKDAWTGTMASPDQGPGTRPIAAVTVAGDTLKLDMPDLHAAYEGKRVDADHIHGTFTQGAALPLDLTHGQPPAGVAHPQEPKPPFPYDAEDVSIENRAANLTLGCTLTHPRTARFPVVVFITGSGQQDRDEAILGHKPFLVIADALARAGIGGLRCDDRGKRKSTGDFAKATTLDFASDVQVMLAWLVARPDVDAKHIGLLGHSEGGVVAPIVASRTKDVAFLVLLAGTGERGDEILMQQQVLVMQAEGKSAAEIAKAQAEEKATLAVLTTEKDEATIRARLKALKVDDALMTTIMSPWFRTFVNLDPRRYLTQVKVPVLALHGARDVQVPAAANARAIREALAGDKDVTVKELPGLNHLFQQCKACSVSEYQTLSETISPSVLTLIVDWVRQHAR